MLLPRAGARKAEVRATGLEHCIRVQRDGSAHQRAAAAHLPGPVRGMATLSRPACGSHVQRRPVIARTQTAESSLDSG